MTKTKRKGPLKVRRHIWRTPVDQIRRGPKTEVLVDGDWVPVESLDVAREYARTHGHRGITIEPLA